MCRQDRDNHLKFTGSHEHGIEVQAISAKDQLLYLLASWTREPGSNTDNGETDAAMQCSRELVSRALISANLVGCEVIIKLYFCPQLHLSDKTTIQEMVSTLWHPLPVLALPVTAIYLMTPDSKKVTSTFLLEMLAWRG